MPVAPYILPRARAGETDYFRPATKDSNPGPPEVTNLPIPASLKTVISRL